MRMLQIFGGDLKEGKTGEFVAWLEANEEALADAHPEGTTYMGTYFAVRGGSSDAGSVFTLVGMNKYGDLDTLAEARGEYERLITEAVAFFDQRNEANGSAVLLKKATEATTYAD